MYTEKFAKIKEGPWRGMAVHSGEKSFMITEKELEFLHELMETRNARDKKPA